MPIKKLLGERRRAYQAKLAAIDKAHANDPVTYGEAMVVLAVKEAEWVERALGLSPGEGGVEIKDARSGVGICKTSDSDCLERYRRYMATHGEVTDRPVATLEPVATPEPVGAKRVDQLPLHALIDDFRWECMMGRVRDGCVSAAVLAGRKPRHLTPQVDFDACHVFDFGYMFNVGSGHETTLTDAEVRTCQEAVAHHGIMLPHPKMLLVERTMHRTGAIAGVLDSESKVFITYIYDTDDGFVVEYYSKDTRFPHWIRVGRIERFRISPDGLMEHRVRGWGLHVPPEFLPEADSSPVNHYLRMSVVLIVMLMRRGDEVEEVTVRRDPRKPPKGIQRRNTQPMSVICLHKRKFIGNAVDEHEAIEVARSVRPHDRAGTISHRIKDTACTHDWVEEFRDETRWRYRCPKCDSCEFWRSEAKVKGGASGIVLHKVAP